MKEMKAVRLLLILIVLILFACKAETPKETKQTKAETPSYGAMTGNIEHGKTLFNDPKFGNGTNGKSCNSCHPNGKGLEQAGKKTSFTIMGKNQNSLEEAVNFCIENALMGKAIDPQSQDMKDIVAYIKSLGK